MMNFLKVALFSLVVIGFFAGYSNWGIPQIEPAAPPVEEVLDLGAMTMDDFIALGGKIYNGKGTCTLCHNAVGGRAPMLDTAAGLVAERLKDARYKGEASDAEGYLLESLVNPSAFVVAGFGKKGTADAESPMPDVSGGSVGLSEVELAAVVAFLQDLGGTDVTVEIPSGAQASDESDDEEGEPRAAYASIEELIAEQSCGACHKVAGEEGDVGPDLNGIGAKYDRDYLRRSILDPNADIGQGFEADTMPAEYGTTLYAQELEMLIDYLAKLK